MINPHMTIGVKDSGTLGFVRHPLLGQRMAPTFSAALFSAEFRDLLAQGTHFRDAIQPDHSALRCRRTVSICVVFAYQGPSLVRRTARRLPLSRETNIGKMPRGLAVHEPIPCSLHKSPN